MEPQLATVLNKSEQKDAHAPERKRPRWLRLLLRHLLSLLIGILGSLIAAKIGTHFLDRVPDISTPSSPTSSVRVRISEVPHRLPSGETQPSRWIRGEVGGLGDPRAYGIVLYAYTNEWYVVPKEDHPFTLIDSDGKWQNYIEGGSYYAAFLVKKLPDLTAFKPPKDPLSLLDSERWITWQVVEGPDNFWSYFFLTLIVSVPLAFVLVWFLSRQREKNEVIREAA